MTQILFIDEVSMVSAEFFTAVERGARAVRGNASPFGGVQLVRKMTQTLLRSLRAPLTPHAIHTRTHTRCAAATSFSCRQSQSAPPPTCPRTRS